MDVPPDAYAQAMLGIYEMGRVELLRDVFIWSYERSTLEYVALRQNLAEPDPLRLTYRSLIKDTVRAVVLPPQADAQTVVDTALPARPSAKPCAKACWRAMACGPASFRRGKWHSVFEE